MEVVLLWTEGVMAVYPVRQRVRSVLMCFGVRGCCVMYCSGWCGFVEPAPSVCVPRISDL